MADVEAIAAQAIDCGFHIHCDLGPGLLETVYEQVLAASLARAGLKVERQKPVSFTFDGMHFADGFRIDLLVEDQLIVEIKSVEALSKAHGKQMLTYLRLMQQPVGLLMNFGGATFKEGIRRIVNNHTAFASSRLRVNQIGAAAGGHA
ncbi:MAG: GxxExxY protein [Sphingopyxis granuli]|uniref:GxxExxY protein n=1 Tax=unclassified Sphingopyxis TaxID=2614943 RepID=UPI00086F9171|nr:MULTISPECIES: GxxExxY protein [unclassified Sphingopyxis]AVA14402.1 GxxExxY protein [Sphingopyxis sp. MG]ODU27394.1 MAG: Fe3+ hydroxamate ABC transporter substrate-binding protein [Sphingopyxis sp. SCN 67-31]